MLARRHGGRIIISIVLLALFITSIAWTAGDRTKLTILESGVRDGLAPIQKVFYSATNSVTGFFKGILNLGTVTRDKKNLEKQVATLQSRVYQLEEQEYQNLRLREDLNFQEQNKNQFTMQLASVIGISQEGWDETITIDRGSSDGVAKGMPVVTPKGLIGRVTAVSGNTATVLLIIDNRSAVGALVQINRTLGVVEGTDDEGTGLRIIHLPKDAPIRVRQTVITSGLGGVFPKGLLIGKVTSVGMESNGLMQYARIQPFANFEHLEEVFVVKGIRPIAIPQTGKVGEY